MTICKPGRSKKPGKAPGSSSAVWKRLKVCLACNQLIPRPLLRSRPRSTLVSPSTQAESSNTHTLSKRRPGKVSSPRGSLKLKRCSKLEPNSTVRATLQGNLRLSWSKQVHLQAPRNWYAVADDGALIRNISLVCRLEFRWCPCKSVPILHL